MKKSLVTASVILALTSGVALAGSPSEPGASVFAGYSNIEVKDGSGSFKPSGYDMGLRVTVGQPVGVFVMTQLYLHRSGR